MPESSASASIIKYGSVRAQEAYVYQLNVQSGLSMKAEIVSATARRRGTAADDAHLVLYMSVGGVKTMDDFAVVSRRRQDGSGGRAAVGNCAGAPIDAGDASSHVPLFVALKNDGWRGNITYAIEFKQEPCSKCTGVVCRGNTECNEDIGAYVSLVSDCPIS